MLCTTENCIYGDKARGHANLYRLSMHDVGQRDKDGNIVSYRRTTKYKCPAGHISLDESIVSPSVVHQEQQRKGTSTRLSRLWNRGERRRRTEARRLARRR